MDIFQRTCINEGVIFGDVNAVEEEIVVSDSETYFEEEQFEDELENQIDVDAIYNELECMKRRIQKFQLILKKKDIEDCPEEERCIDYEVLLNCSENREICDLQKSQYKVQCQINEIIECCKYAKDQIADVRAQICRQQNEIMEIQKLLGLLNSWRMTLEHEFGLCIERFEYIKTVKVEWSNIIDKLAQQKEYFHKANNCFVPKSCFVRDKEDFVKTINDMRENIRELFEYTQKRFDIVEKMKVVEKPGVLSSKSSTRLKTNKLGSSSSLQSNVLRFDSVSPKSSLT